MKARNLLALIVAAAVLGMVASYQHVMAAGAGVSAGSQKIAVVSVKEIFQKSKKNDDYKNKMTAEQDQIIAQLEKLAKEVEALEADLKTRKKGTDEYLKLMKDISEKKSSLESQKDYYQEQFKMKDQAWTEKLYLEVLAKVATVAKEKGFDLVLEKDDIELPAQSATELMLIIRTHKVLFFNENLDITNAVLAAMDTEVGASTGTSDQKK